MHGYIHTYNCTHTYTHTYTHTVAQEQAAKEAAEAAAQALAAGEGEAPAEEVNPEEEDSNKKLDKTDEAAEARYRKLEADFREKIKV